MVNSDQIQNEITARGNSEDSLLVIYILHILKKYSSKQNPLSSQDVMAYLKEDYSIGIPDKSDAQRKKVRRHLDTLHESYLGRCIKKLEGKTRNGHKWFYDASKDKFAQEDVVIQETLTETEVDLLVDLVLATKILNSEGTLGLVDKLLKKASISDEGRVRRLAAIQKEEWFKTPNEDLAEKKDCIQEYIDECDDIEFDYENEETITATPLSWSYDEGICYLNAKVGDKYRKFSLDQIRNYRYKSTGYEDLEDFRRYDEETDSDKTTLDSLFINIPTIKSAITDKKCIRFLYRSYVIDDDRVVSTDEEKSVLPHSLVFNDGKYFLIGIDENSAELNKVAYFRVDLMFELNCAKPKIKTSNWDKHIFETIERARVVEKHPLMLVGNEVMITFKVVESALDRVIDAFAVKPDKFDVTEETRMVKDSSREGFHEERVVSVKVVTTIEEAFRWALANADVVEVTSQDVRDRIARISDPIYQLYTQTLSDKVRENIDYVLKEGTFKISSKVDAATAYATYKELAKMGKLDAVTSIGIFGEEGCNAGDYLGEFIHAEHLEISSSKIKDLSWAAKLVNVSVLEMFSVEIDDVSWMKEMKKLSQVCLCESTISDLSAISEHKDIRYLDISGINVSDISFIENFQKLTQLHIATCPIEDYSPLFTTQSHLKYLEIDKNTLEKIGEENIRNRHIGITIKVTNNSPFWFI